MNFVSLVGFGAGTLCTLAYLPQALHSFRTKSVRDLSLSMLLSLNVGLVLWVAYGFLIHSLPLILPNAITFFLAFPLLLMKLRYHEPAAAGHDGGASEASPNSH
ncbi:MAG TPA: SemiSWEET transporter [Terriglobales bacterium]|jgi:MtN3 and saliva related transmembrane protein